MYTTAFTAIEETLGKEHSEAAEILHNLGLVNHQLGNYDEAIRKYEAALRIVRKEFGEQHYKVGMFLNSSGLARAMKQDYMTSHFELKQSLQILIKTLGKDHVEVADCYANLGDVCMKLHVEASGTGKLAEAEKNYREANRIIKSALGENHPKCQQFASLLFICQYYNELS